MPSRRQKPPCPVELSNVALRMAPRMHQYMELENHKFKKKFWEGALPKPDFFGPV